MTRQNTSTAVMQRRRVAPDSLDYYPTPPFATRALCEWLQAQGEAIGAMEAWEPACGEMHMVRPLREYFEAVRASDVHRYCPDHELLDFVLLGDREPAADWVISNPPFRLAEAFIATALKVARRGVAMLVRSAFLESEARVLGLFERDPPSVVLVFAERVVMLEGRLIRTGAPDPFNPDDDGAPRKASTATSYAWLVWLKPCDGDTRLRWLPPCRLRLERPGDYPAYPMPAGVAGPLL